MARATSFLAALRFLWENADELAMLLRKLPSALRRAGASITAAGEGALRAGRALGGETSPEDSAAHRLKAATAVLRQMQQHMTELAGEVRTVAEALDQVRVPAVTPVKQRFNLKLVGLGEPELLTGLTIGEQPLPFLTSLSSRLRVQAATLEDNLTGQLDGTAAHLDRLGESLEEIGERVLALGASLKEGGGALEEFGALAGAAPTPGA